jgi:hypothetical protein
MAKDISNPQFSSDVSGDPLELAAEAEASEEKFLELQQYLMTNPDYLAMGLRQSRSNRQDGK